MDNFLLISNERRIFAIFLLSVFLISISYSFYFKVVPAVDARAYDNIAWNIVNGHGYREEASGPLAEDNAIMRVGPGYEVFLAVIYYLFGHNYWAVWIIQALLLAFSSLFIFLSTKNIFGSEWSFGIGLMAAALVGFSPDLITIQSMLMSETLGIFLVSALIYSVFLYFKQLRSLAFAGAIGLLFAFTVMVRTPALFLFPIIAFLLWKKGGKKHFFVFFIAIMLAFSPWIIRNWKVYGTFIPTNLAYGVDLASGNHPGASGELEPYEINDQYLGEYGFVKGTRLLTKEAFKFILENPLEFLKITLYRISIYFSFSRPTGFWFHLHGFSRAATLAASALYSAILFILGFLGIAKIRELNEANKEKAKFLLLMLAMIPIAIIVIIVETRYRFLVYPFFAIFAGYGFQKVLEKRLVWKSDFLIILSLLLLNTGFDALRNLNRIFERIFDLTK